MSYIKDRIDEFEMEEAYSKPKGDIYCFQCKNFKIKDLGNGYSEIICLKEHITIIVIVNTLKGKINK